MLRGLYISATGMVTLQKNMDTVINNMTNAETTGYKQDTFLSRSFRDVLIERINDPSVLRQVRQVGPLNYGVHVDEIATSITQGGMEQTDRSADLALTGNAFFTVQAEGGERYTRAGNFSINDQGVLCTAAGEPVLGQNGPVNVGGGDFTVDSLGGIWVGGQQVDTLRLAGFEDPAVLRKEGGNLFYAYNANPGEATDYSVRQGFLETSNVDLSTVMVDMMSVYRAYETNQRMIQMIDSTLEKAVNQIGNV